jgi:hypothetical protein
MQGKAKAAQITQLQKPQTRSSTGSPSLLATAVIAVRAVLRLRARAHDARLPTFRTVGLSQVCGNLLKQIFPQKLRKDLALISSKSRPRPLKKRKDFPKLF